MDTRGVIGVVYSGLGKCMDCMVTLGRPRGRLFEVLEVFGDPWGSYGVIGCDGGHGYLEDQRGS